MEPEVQSQRLKVRRRGEYLHHAFFAIPSSAHAVSYLTPEFLNNNKPWMKTPISVCLKTYALTEVRVVT